MHHVLMGVLSAVSLGFADFMASQSALRLGALRALIGMLFVSSIVLTGYVVWSGQIFEATNTGIWFACLHGITMSCALLLFFHALSIGPINIVAPIIAAHPIFVVAFALSLGSRPSWQQLAAMVGIIAGIVIVASTGKHAISKDPDELPLSERRRRVLGISLAASFVYAVALVCLQKAAPHQDDTITLWLGRLSGLLILLPVLPLKGETLALPIRWWPFFGLHGLLDSGGLLFLLLGSSGSFPEITVVVASTFSVVTVALAWVFLNERMSWFQGSSIALIMAGVAVLALGY